MRDPPKSEYQCERFVEKTVKFRLCHCITGFPCFPIQERHIKIVDIDSFSWIHFRFSSIGLTNKWSLYIISLQNKNISNRNYKTGAGIMSGRPNILFVLTDDQGAWAMGCSGNHELQTPIWTGLPQKGFGLKTFSVFPRCARRPGRPFIPGRSRRSTAYTTGWPRAMYQSRSWMMSCGKTPRRQPAL